MRGREGVIQLGGLLNEIANEAVDRASRLPIFDLGTMQAGGALRVHSWREGDFAPGDYGYVVHDTYTEPLTTTYPTVVTGGPHGHPDAGDTASHDHTPHIHDVVRPPEMLPLILWPPGTTVLVLWLYGTRPVILGRLAA